MKTKMLFASVALALASGLASANDIQVDAGAISQNVGGTYANVFLHDAGTFADTIDFTAPAGTLSSSLNPLNVALTTPTFSFNVFNIANLAYSVYSGTSASGGTLLDTYLGDNTTQNLALSAGGAYHVLVTGLANGSAGGSYGVALVSSVPEPETYAMMLGGIGLLGFMARRRKRG